MVRKTAKLKSSRKTKYSMAWRIGVIAVLVLLSLWQLFPSLRYFTTSDAAKAAMDPSKLEELKRKALNLGLDLQGGIHLVMQVDTQDMDEKEATDAVDRAITVIENRVNQFGLTEPIVQKQGTNRIIVELPGERDVERAKELIGKTARLEFKLLRGDQDIRYTIDRIDAYLAGNKDIALADTTASATADTTKAASADTAKVAAADTAKKGLFDQQQPSGAETGTDTAKRFSSLLSYQQTGGDPSFDVLVKETNVPRVKAILSDSGVQEILVNGGVMLLWGPEDARTDGNRELFLLNATNEMTGDRIADARVQLGSGMQAGQPEIEMETTGEGTSDFARITGANVGKRLAIVLDNIVYSAPNIRERIPSGTAQITGNFTMDEARDLALVLRSGALPASVEVMEDRTVGPSLGADSIRASRNAFIIAMVALVAFMIFYYMGQGLIAVFALALNALFVLAYLAFFNATLTLPGMAGIILTMGMAVDANVLVFERIREELRLGSSSRVAIDNGYFKARWTILDSNITTFLTGIILYNFGTGPVKGFALTLMVGIVSTVFTALFASKVLTDLLTRKLDHISVGKLTVFQNAKFPFINFRKRAYLLSGAVILVGLISLIGHGGPKYSIDFKGGTLMELHFDKPVTITAIRDALGAVNVQGTDLATSEIQFIGEGNQDVLIRVVKVGDMEETSTQVKSALRTKLAEAVPSDPNNWVLREEMVGPTIGGELQGQAWKAIIWSLLVLLIYITIRFEFKYSLGAILALAHDTLIVVGIFSLMGEEISLTVIAAILALIGYSLNDTIVVFDRIREKVRKGVQGGYIQTLDNAINETLARTTITAFTTLIAVLALFFFGGEVIHGFSLALVIGIIVGTYSSVFVAAPVLVEWYNRMDKKRKSKL